MTLNLSAHKWFKPALWIFVSIVITLVWLHLAGAVVLAGAGRDYNKVNTLTFIQYAVYFGEQK